MLLYIEVTGLEFIYFGTSSKSSCLSVLHYVIQAKETKVQIVSLGAGLDTLYFNLLENNESKNNTFLEIDLPSVVSKKVMMVGFRLLKFRVRKKFKICSKD